MNAQQVVPVVTVKCFGKCPGCDGLMAGAGTGSKEQLEMGEATCDRCGWAGVTKDLKYINWR